MDQGQTGRQAGGGEPAGTGRKKGIVCRNPTKGPGPQCRGFFREKQTCLSFYQLLLKQPIGFDSLLFHPKQMINKQTLVSSEGQSQEAGPMADWTCPPWASRLQCHVGLPARLLPGVWASLQGGQAPGHVARGSPSRCGVELARLHGPQTRGDTRWRGWGSTSEEEMEPGCREGGLAALAGTTSEKVPACLLTSLSGSWLWSDFTAPSAQSS